MLLALDIGTAGRILLRAVPAPQLCSAVVGDSRSNAHYPDLTPPFAPPFQKHHRPRFPGSARCSRFAFTEQHLNGPQVLRSPVDQRDLGPPHRMRAIATGSSPAS